MTRQMSAPSAETTEAIAALEAAGYVVLRRKSHEHTLRELDRARLLLEAEKRATEDAEAWGREACKEQRRLTDRLHAVCVAVAALGVSIQDIGDALKKADR